MVYQFSSTKTILDPVERAQRLAVLFAIFEVASDIETIRQDSPMSEAETTPTKGQRSTQEDNPNV